MDFGKLVTETPGDWQARIDAKLAEEEAEAERRRRDAVAAARVNGIRTALSESGMAHSLTDADLAALESGELDESVPCLVKVRNWLSSDRPILLLAGPVGRGKTVAAAWAVTHGARTCDWEWAATRESLRPPVPVAVTAHSVLRTFAGRYGAALTAQERVLHASLLVIDDVGREHERERSDMASALTEIIDQRRNTSRRTLITSNMSLPEFKSAYGDDRLLSRLYQSAEWYVDDGADMRRAK